MMKKSAFLCLLVVMSVLLGGVTQSVKAATEAGVALAYAGGLSFGGSLEDNVGTMYVDPAGNMYVAGSFEGTTDFDPGGNTNELTSAGSLDIFVAKIDPVGNLLWARRIGSSGFDAANALTVDSSGNVWLTGEFEGTVDFSPTQTTVNLSSSGSSEAFLLKLNSNGVYVWAASWGAASIDTGRDIAIDGNGNVHVIGYYSGTVDFNPAGGLAFMTSSGGVDSFMTTFSNNGTFLWAKSVGGSGSDYPFAITLDASNNIYLQGDFQDTADFDPGAGKYELSSAGSFDVYVGKWSSAGDLIWVKQLGGPGIDRACDVALDASGNVISVGTFSDVGDFNPGNGLFDAHELWSAGGKDIFISALDPAGNFAWAQSLGGVEDETVESLDVDVTGHIFVAGYFDGAVDFDPSQAVVVKESAGVDDVFLGIFNSGGGYAHVETFGGIDSERGHKVYTHPDGSVYLAGQIESLTDFDPSVSKVEYSSKGAEDVFLMKYKLAGLSAPTNDGWILESGEYSNKGGKKNNNASTLLLGDNSDNRQYRSILSFDTAYIPDVASINKVILRLHKAGVTGGGNPLNIFKGLIVDVKTGSFGNLSLGLGDFSAKPGETFGAFKPTLNNGWFEIELTDAVSLINKTGVTQIRVRFKIGDDNNRKANILKISSGNTDVPNRPQLIVEYALP